MHRLMDRISEDIIIYCYSLISLQMSHTHSLLFVII